VTTIKAIETHYKGCHFRSRLEARWAVFLDVLGVRWEYEKQGFDLPSGPYLPDFWIVPAANGRAAWLEIKPEQPTKGERDLVKELAESSGSVGLIFAGSPWHNEQFVYVFLPSGAETNVTAPMCQFLATGNIGFLATVEKDDTAGFVFFPGIDLGALKSGALNRAFRAARSARFEHGETPQGDEVRRLLGSVAIDAGGGS